MKKLIILILPLLLFLSCHNQTSNKQVSLKFFPWPDVGKETLSIQSMNIYQNQKFIEAIEKGRKKLFFDKIPKSAPIEGYYGISIKENDLKGIYTYFSRADSLEEDILQIFLDKVGKIPIAQNILISSKETSYEEMQAFFHRAILCEENTLFVVELNGSFSSFQQRNMNNFIDNILTFKNDDYNKKNENRFRI